MVDDDSADDTVSIVQGFGDRVRLIRRKQNSGTADIPRYEGVLASRGEFCAFLDSDDLWLPEKLQRQVDFLRAHPEIPLVHSYVMVMDENGDDLFVRHEGCIPPTGRISAQLLRHCFISTSSVVVHRNVWLSAQRQDEIVGYGTEWDFFLAIARKYPIGFIPEVLAKYRRYEASVSHRDWRRAPRDVLAKERILRKGLWRGTMSRNQYIDIILEACAENAQFWRDHGFTCRSALFALKGLRYRPASYVCWRHLIACLTRGRHLLRVRAFDELPLGQKR